VTPSPSPSTAHSASASQITPETVSRLRQGTLRLARRLRQEADSGFGQSLVSALSTVYRHGPITLGELAEHERLTPPSITKLVGRLEDEGLIERATRPEDKRSVTVSVTPAGAERVEAARRRTTEWLALRVGSLTDDDRAKIDAATEVLEALLAEEQ
jgi:DNA-binding MarR family transcriptional regulator